MTAQRAFSVIIMLLAMHLTATTRHVSQHAGSLTGDGSSANPFVHISQAAQIAQPGDTVLVHGGIYRERVVPERGGSAGNPITYLAVPGDTVTIRGSVVWNPQWNSYTSTPGLYFAHLADTLFADTSQKDGPNPFRVILGGSRKSKAVTLGQVFVDGVRLTEVDSIASMDTATWFFDSSGSSLFVSFPSGTGPSNSTVEITNQRRLFAPHKRGLGYITVKGFIFEHCGNQYPASFYSPHGHPQAGMVGTRSGHHWIIEENVIRLAKNIGLDIGTESDGNDLEIYDYPRIRSSSVGWHTVRNNLITNNGSSGIMGYNPRYCRIANNIISGSNYLQMKGNEKAGMKLHGLYYSTIEGNLVVHNNTPGIYLDNRFYATHVSRNIVAFNNAYGMFFELQYTSWSFTRPAVVDNNIIVNNAANGIYSHDVSNLILLHNLIANTKGSDGYGSWAEGFFFRSSGSRDNFQLKNIHAYNNLLLRNQGGALNFPYPNCENDRVDYNLSDYNVASGEDFYRQFYLNPKCGGRDERPWMVWSDVDSAYVDSVPFHEMVYTEIESLTTVTSSAFIAPSWRGARLTLQEWRDYWKRYDQNNDAHSRMTMLSTVDLDSTNWELTIDLDFDPATVGSLPHDSVGTDFNGTPIRQDGTALPGPFQNLGEGSHSYKVWPPAHFPDFEFALPSANRMAPLPPSGNFSSNTVSRTVFGTASLLHSAYLKKGVTYRYFNIYDASGRIRFSYSGDAHQLKATLQKLKLAGGIFMMRALVEKVNQQ
ncbi:MAG: hypothetical protein GF398_00460 [Chitinivibrionales bacterium]|nr:hypothetical protein [Chitinivibrionales bacterium]